MFGLSPSEMLIVGVVAILLFGSRLPSVARSLGKSVTEFRRGMNDLQHEFRSAMNEADEAARSPVAGAQGRLSGPAAVAHQDSSSRDDGASDTVYDTREPIPAEEDAAEEAVADVDRREGSEATSPSATG